MYWFWSQLMSEKEENCQAHDSSKSTQVHPSHNPTQNKVQNLDKKHWRLISCNKNTNRFHAHFWIKTLYPICDLWCFFVKSCWWLWRLPSGTPTPGLYSSLTLSCGCACSTRTWTKNKQKCCVGLGQMEGHKILKWHKRKAK